ncbi:MAG TPA: tRNA pseudouridine(55) synthase TruB [Chitinophagaceae bacterium]|jgi:tRNA pseudouridine55 synthase
MKYEEGELILIDKPLGWTSFAVVRELRNLLGVRKIGHAGTLDPLASGLLILCTGKWTKRINEYMAQEKEYTGTITLGASTASYDLETTPVALKDTSGITEQQVREAVSPFTGEIWQVPPAHSAIKKDGKRVYELARRGEAVKLEPRKITINVFEITHIALPVVSFRVVCTTGTYIRSLANDFGAALGCGGYLSSLCRTRIGRFELKDAWNMKQAEEKIKQYYDSIKTGS